MGGRDLAPVPPSRESAAVLLPLFALGSDVIRRLLPRIGEAFGVRLSFLTLWLGGKSLRGSLSDFGFQS